MNSLAFLPDEPPQEEKIVGNADHLLQPVGRANFFGRDVRLWGSESDPLFMVEEIRPILGFSASTTTLLKGHPENEKLKYLVDTSDQGRQMWFVNEPGLYRLIFKSRRPEAENFKTLIFNEVLPTLRRFGQYPAPKGRQIEPVKLTAELDALLPAEARSLPLRRQRIIAERLHCVRMVENAPHFGLRKKINHVVATRRQQGRPRRGFSWSAIYRFHRAYSQSGDWRCLDTHFENSGRRQIGG